MGVDFGNMNAGHFIFIPAVLLVGIVIGWILGSRAAADAYAAELRRREARRAPAPGDAGRAMRVAGAERLEPRVSGPPPGDAPGCRAGRRRGCGAAPARRRTRRAPA